VPEKQSRFPTTLLLAVLVALPGLYFGAASYFGLPHPEIPAPLAAVVYGIAIVGAAFVLSWAAEAAQCDVSAGLALALLALLAVLPEYAVDFVFTWQAGQIYAQHGECVPLPNGSNPCALALANMTGANRVLVGVGWPLVVLVASLAVLRARRQGETDSASSHAGRVTMPRTMSAEVVFLGIATLYSLHLPLRTSLTLIDTIVLVSIFVLYAWRLSKAPTQRPDLWGTAAWVGAKDDRARKRTYIAMFTVAALIILATAEHFAENLVDTGTQLGINQFVLVQWVAPLASESPELIVASLYAWRLKASDSLGTLLSSKVNQWTLLVGTIPLVFAISSFSLNGLPLTTNQRFELLITAAQSLFAVSILITLRISLRSAAMLFVLFAVQFVSSFTVPPQIGRIVIIVLSALYGVLAVAQFVRHRRELVRTTKDGLVTPFDELAEADQAAAAK
jgi:cation:H+ antiporter